MAHYQYKGNDLTISDANPEYELDIVAGDKLIINKFGAKFEIYHETATDIQFIVSPAIARRIIKASEEVLAIRPDPNRPPYLMFEPVFDVVPDLYEHYNKELFNGQCPRVLFRKIRKKNILGLAEMEMHRGKPIYTFYINESTMVDRILFTDTIVHEMIHLYLYAKGVREGKQEYITDGHGPHFRSEMHRINKLGFNVTVVVEGEHYQGETTQIIYGYRVDYRDKVQIYYTHKPLTHEKFAAFCEKYQTEKPDESGAVITFFKSKDKAISQYTPLPTSGNVATRMLDKWYVKPASFEVEVLDKYTTTKRSNSIPDWKVSPELYLLPFDQFQKKMERYGADHNYVYERWKRFPFRNLSKEMEEAVRVLIGRVARNSIDGADLYNKLVDIRGSFKGRVADDKYREFMRNLLSEFDRKGVMVEHYRVLGLR